MSWVMNDAHNRPIRVFRPLSWTSARSTADYESYPDSTTNADVTQAIAHESSQLVALKVCRSGSRLAREALALSAFDHPLIPRLIDVGGFTANPRYVAIEWMDGPSVLDVTLRKHRFPPGIALAVVRDIASALSHSHAAGIVHRDVKPSNVVISRGHGCLIDFDCSRRYVRAQHSPSTLWAQKPRWPRESAQRCYGTLSYLPPEGLFSCPRRYAQSYDMYSLGLVLDLMLSGFEIFQNRHESAEYVVRPEVAVNPRRYDTRIPKAVAKLCQAMTEPKVSNRLQSFNRLIGAIDTFSDVATPRAVEQFCLNGV